MFRSATLKLTASYLAIITLLCLMFSGAIYHFATDELHEGLYRQSQRLSDEYPNFNFAPSLKPDRDITTSSHRILLNLIYFNLIVLISAGFASYGLARWTLRPIEAAHEQQKRFTADVSHELRTPLTSLKMTSEVALMDPSATKSELRDALASTVEDAAKLDMLINNLLRLTRLEASELAAEFKAVSVKACIEAACTEIRDRADARGISVRSSISKAGTVMGDAASLTQLVTILLDNAVKYSPEGAEVKVNASGTGDEVSIEVVDQGIGIAAKDLPHIFDRFYRADEARTGSEYGGYGLGLSIAHLITELHHGTISVTSQPGKGTTVSVLLPRL